MNHKTELFETVPIPKAVLTFALPTILGMLITVAYIFVDTFFVAQTGDPNQVAAITICMPVFMLCMAWETPLSISPRRFKPNKMIMTSVLAIGIPIHAD
jgi:Na+-driven multidrug efflux pump